MLYWIDHISVPCVSIKWDRIFQLEYPERTTNHGQATGKLYHLRLRVECTLFCNLQSRVWTHTVLVIGLEISSVYIFYLMSINYTHYMFVRNELCIHILLDVNQLYTLYGGLLEISSVYIFYLMSSSKVKKLCIVLNHLTSCKKSNFWIFGVLHHFQLYHGD
jgi:hypothetical protein